MYIYIFTELCVYTYHAYEKISRLNLLRHDASHSISENERRRVAPPIIAMYPQIHSSSIGLISILLSHIYIWGSWECVWEIGILIYTDEENVDKKMN